MTKQFVIRNLKLKSAGVPFVVEFEVIWMNERNLFVRGFRSQYIR